MKCVYTKVFVPPFYKKVVGCGRKAHDLDLFLQSETTLTKSGFSISTKIKNISLSPKKVLHFSSNYDIIYKEEKSFTILLKFSY